jgi:hypothetical protein
VYWPLIVGLIAFILISLLLGRIMDTSGRDDAGDGHH